MELEHSFTVPVPEERAWEVLLDVERVAPCMPGATLDAVDGDAISGKIKVKVGPIAMTYAGTAKFTERDEHAHLVTLEASGKETRGAGTASATVRSMLEGRGDETHVIVHTTLNVTGKPAQFGRGVMAEVGERLIGIFAGNLADMLAAGSPAAVSGQEAGPGTGHDHPAARHLAAADGAATGRPADQPSPAAGADDLALPIEELDLPLRAYNSLRREGIHTIGDLVARTPRQLLSIENIGRASVEDIRQRLAARGLGLSESAGSADGAEAESGGPATGAPAAAPAAAGRPAAGTAPTPAVTPLRSVPASGEAWQPPEDDAIDLLSVAGVPVLKRALPVAGGLLLLLLVLLGLRRRSRARR
jgi:carbon monoxide dehydrogenase subunit G